MSRRQIYFEAWFSGPIRHKLEHLDFVNEEPHGLAPAKGDHLGPSVHDANPRRWRKPSAFVIQNWLFKDDIVLFTTFKYDICTINYYVQLCSNLTAFFVN